MYVISTTTRIVLLSVVSMLLYYSIFPMVVQAEQLQRTITITEQQEWGQIIVDSNTTEFDVDIITPDGTKWSHSEETDVDVLFYYAFENKRHWAAETMKVGTYQVIIDGPASASYTIRNQDSYDQLELQLVKPNKQIIDVQEPSYTFEATWSYTGDILRSNAIDFYLISAVGGEKIKLGSSSISLTRWSLNIPDELIDGSYKLFVLYDNNTADYIELDPEVTFQIKRGVTGEKIDIMEVSPAGDELYTEINLSHTNVQGIEVSLVDSSGIPSNFNWTRYELSELTKIEAPELNDDKQITNSYDHRYALFIPVLQNGSYKLAVRLVSKSELPGAITISEQQVDIQSKEWPADLVSWSLPDGVTNEEYGQLSITYHEPIHVQLMADGQLVFEQEIDGATEPWIMQIPLSEGEHSYELVIYDKYGNYFTDGRIWTVDHTAPWLDMIGPLASHSHIPNNLVSGWTESNATIKINNKEIEVDELGYFQFKTKSSSLDIVVTDESGNETVYHWSANSESNGFSSKQWILFIIGISIVVGVVLYLFLRHRK